MDFPPLPSEKEFNEDQEEAAEVIMRIRQMMSAANQAEQMLQRMQAPLAVPDMEPEGREADSTADATDEEKSVWLPYATAANRSFRQRLLKEPVNPALERLQAIFAAYRDNDVVAFNREVARYHELLASQPPEDVNLNKVAFESYYNYSAPFYFLMQVYVLAFLLSLLSLLIWHKPLGRAAAAVLVFALLIHTFGLIARIYISGRPPITNLYSSAVFISWSFVVFGLILEAIYRLGVGNLVGAIGGFTALIIAHFLGFRGDTFTVLQAVLDTQFWLATHVVCITLGYGVTFVAGLLGIFYIFVYILSATRGRTLDKEFSRTLVRMIYGIVCFALFFSFVGTVLGGLWADDSWGRFWGWDPKENGALIIVLWNAIILHARWDGMVRERGVAVLAVGGNIATMWSWFGVNELSVGLHSYGFTEGALMWLAIVATWHFAVILLGCAPLDMWQRFSPAKQQTA
jgi:ABC-type transport system involved in cytochrome c biogenesis permease subunit